MVQRSKRSMSPHKAAEMQRELREFHWKVRQWCSEVPIGETVYVALEGLNHALILTGGQLQATMDGGRYERAPGAGGLD